MEEALSFAHNRQVMYAVCHSPEGPPARVGVLTVPGYRIGTPRFLVSAARRLAKHGYAVMRCDLTGYGDSTGERTLARSFNREDHARYVQEIQAACKLFRERFRLDQVIVLGKCWGGRYALGAALDCPEVDGLVLISVPLWSEDARLRWLAQQDRTTVLKKMMSWSRWRVTLYSREWLREDWERMKSLVSGLWNGGSNGEADRYFLDALVRFLESGRRVLAFYGTPDPVTPIFTHQVEENRQLQRHVHSGTLPYELYPEADHNFTGLGVSEQVIERSLRWLGETVRVVR